MVAHYKALDFSSPEQARKAASIEMEEEIIGGILLDPDILPEVGDLPVAAFTTRTHRLIFASILEVAKSGLKPDANTLACIMGNNGTLADAGGKIKLGQLMERVLHSGFVGQYAGLLHEDYKRTSLSTNLKKAVELAESGDVPGAIEKAQEQLARVNGDGSLKNKSEATSKLEQAAEDAKTILLAKHPELTENIELEKLRSISGMSSYDWTNKIIKPLKRDLDAERFRLDLLNLLAVADPVEQLRQQALLAPRYQMSSGVVDKALALIKQRTVTAATQSFNLDDFFTLQSKALDWLIPGMLLVGETVIVAGVPKSGKTLIALDAAFCIATGESLFLKEVVKQGRVLIVSTDESPDSTRDKLLKRGFRRSDSKNVEIMLGFSIDQIALLEERIRIFKPTLVIVDSLKRITHGQTISENSAEFADHIYTLKELFTRHNTSGMLIHHTNKSQDAMGVGKIRGSSAIAGAVWGTWLLEQIPRPDPNNKKKLVINPKDPNRIFSLFARDVEGQQLHLELDLENNSWTNHGDPSSTPQSEKEKQTLRVRILDVLKKNIHLPGLNGREIIDLLGVAQEQKYSIYSELGRMVSKRLITCTPAPGDKRYNIYSLPKSPPDSDNPPPPPPPEPPINDGNDAPDSDPLPKTEVTIPPPSPPPSVSVAYQSAESYTQQGFSVVSKIVSNQLASSKQVVEDIPPDNYSNVDTAIVSEIVSNAISEVGGGCIENATSPTPTALLVTDNCNLQIGDRVTDKAGNVVEITRLVQGGWMTFSGEHVSRSDLKAGNYTKVTSTYSDSSELPVELLRPTDEWTSEENIEELAHWLSECDSIEMLAEIRELCPYPGVLKTAAKKLDVDKFQQIKEWVVELNGKSEID